MIASNVLPNKPGIKLGRAFNHLEDLVFFYGSEGATEAIQHLREMATVKGAASVRMKWDGNYQIYWGREQEFGPLMFAGHNGWSKGYKTSNPADLVEFITDKSGSPKTPEECAARLEFAHSFASLYDLFDAATPKDFVGFVYADVLFSQKQQINENNVFEFRPNPKSQTCYHVHIDSVLGKRIKDAHVMVAGHAYFSEFGMDDSDQIPIDDFTIFDNTAELIVQGPIYNRQLISVSENTLEKLETYVAQYATEIDRFLEGVVGLSDLKDIIYRYVNQTAKAKSLNQLGVVHFFDWLKHSKVSAGKQTKIQSINNQNALVAIFGLVKQIMDIKDSIIDQIESGVKGDIWDSCGEGRVRYSALDKKFGNIKLVPRKRWTPQ